MLVHFLTSIPTNKGSPEAPKPRSPEIPYLPPLNYLPICIGEFECVWFSISTHDKMWRIWPVFLPTRYFLQKYICLVCIFFRLSFISFDLKNTKVWNIFKWESKGDFTNPLMTSQVFGHFWPTYIPTYLLLLYNVLFLGLS